jgi:hypothetical protein
MVSRVELDLSHECNLQENVWIMFDHVKCVVGWTTMACHVYDLVYYKMLTIVVCDMQSKDTEVHYICGQSFMKRC